jgi:ubiquitin carboxyl-terminal hydrolase 7
MTNAYMLVYIRESYQDEVLASVTEHDIPTHLIESIKQEQAIIEEQNKQRAEQHLYMTAYMTTDKSFKRNTGRGFISEYEQPKTADEEEKDPPPVIEIKRVLKSQTLEDFHVNYAKEHDMKPNQFRIWNMMNRRNETVRLDTPFTNDDYDLCKFLLEVEKDYRLIILFFC